jgi:hypothetical protein
MADDSSIESFPGAPALPADLIHEVAFCPTGGFAATLTSMCTHVVPTSDFP